MGDYGELILPGCTPGWVELSRLPSGVYILNLCAGEPLSLCRPPVA